MTTITRDCFSCRFADIYDDARIIRTDFAEVVQNGEKNIRCMTSPKELTFNGYEIICGSWEPKEEGM